MKRLIAALFFAPSAFADQAAYHAAFQRGHYIEAAEIAADVRNADTLALAARALLAGAMSGDSQPDQSVLAEAEAAARQALVLEPDHVEGRLQLAIALSLKMRPMTTGQARRTGHANAPRELAESVLEDEPGNAYAHGLLAVWNVEVVRRGGPFGSAIMGASVREARRHYDKAVSARPGDASIHWQYARALAALNPKKYRHDIEAALGAAFEAPLDDALEATMAERCRRLGEALAALPADTVEALAEEML